MREMSADKVASPCVPWAVTEFAQVTAFIGKQTLVPAQAFPVWGAMQFSKSSKMRVSVCVCMLVAQLCPTFCDPRDNSPPGSSVHGILQARILGSHSILQGIFLTQGSNLGLLHCGHNQDHCLK